MSSGEGSDRPLEQSLNAALIDEPYGAKRDDQIWNGLTVNLDLIANLSKKHEHRGASDHKQDRTPQ